MIKTGIGKYLPEKSWGQVGKEIKQTRPTDFEKAQIELEIEQGKVDALKAKGDSEALKAAEKITNKIKGIKNFLENYFNNKN